MRDVLRGSGLASACRLAPIFYGGLRALGVPAMNRRFQDAGVILCYHNVVPADDAASGGAGLHVTCDRFERQVRWLADRYTVVSLREFVDQLESGDSLRSTAAITFDDGYAGVLEHALPILRALELPATILVVAGAVGRSTGFWWDQPDIVDVTTPERRQQWLKELAGDGDTILARNTRSAAQLLPRAYRPTDWNLIRAATGRDVDVGVHSATHRALPLLSDADLDDEIVASRATIQRATGASAAFFAYPYGQWDARVRDRVRAAGYRAALTLDRGLNRSTTDPWSLRRINVPARVSDAAFEAWAAGLGIAASA